jgi:hypothetical protein
MRPADGLTAVRLGRRAGVNASAAEYCRCFSLRPRWLSTHAILSSYTTTYCSVPCTLCIRGLYITRCPNPHATIFDSRICDVGSAPSTSRPFDSVHVNTGAKQEPSHTQILATSASRVLKTCTRASSSCALLFIPGFCDLIGWVYSPNCVD